MKTFILCFLLALPAVAVEPYLVKDIEPVAAPTGSKPSHLIAFRDAVLFFADDGLSGRRLWRSDGTEEGTFPLSDAGFPQPMPFAVTERLYFFVSAHPEAAGGDLWVTDGTPAGTFRLTDPGVRVVRLTQTWIAGKLYFVADDSVHGPELWRTNGTPRGTRLVADIYPGGGSSQVSELTAYRGGAWFIADDGQRGGALWRSDGTSAGTVLAVDPVPSSSSHVSPEHLRVLGKRLTFAAPNPGSGRNLQLWAGDGTAQGTKPVTGFSRKALQSHVVHAGRLWFTAADGRTLQLWVSDGTGRGTRMLLGLPFDHFSYPLPKEQGLRGLFVFRWLDPDHGEELWVSDGTPQGTRRLLDACPGPCSSSPWVAKRFQGRLYFVGGNRLWVTDGTPEGTSQVSDLGPGGAFGFFIAGNRLLFVAEDGEEGWEIWQTDGTASGTFPITDFEPQAFWDLEEGLYGAAVNGLLLFNADDGAHGLELWSTDGLVEDINRTDVGGSFPTALHPMGDEVVFAVQKDSELWRSDGTAEGTVLIRAFGPEDADGALPTEVFAEAGGMLFYFANSTGGSLFVPWRTDGTAAGTFRLTEEGMPGCCLLPEMEAVGSRVFFGLRDEEHGHELWASDGTREGTRRVRDLAPGTQDSVPGELTAFQGMLYFTAAAVPGERRLWRSDGTEAGTVPVHPVDTGSPPALPTVHGGRLWFFASDAEHGRELWSTDGTEAGTRLEVEFVPGPDFFLATTMTSLGDRLVVSFYQQGLWVTDGTPGGAFKIGESEVGLHGHPRAVFHGRLYYVSQDSNTLWVTAGTQTGTRPLLDREGREIYGMSRIVVLGDRLVFNAADFSGFLVLWESDGMPAGSFQVEPRVEIGSPLDLVRAGDRVFFPSYDPFTGWELWAVRP